MISLCRRVRVTNHFLPRLYSSDVNWSSSDVRKRFIEYFVNENSHKFLRSSPLRPISDQTIPFVNAGMVQFKSVLQGKHNDLDAVGLDGYHHTFFEMLGSWSFGSCDKAEACKMAWKLLTGPFGLSPARLYVTYFGGDGQMGLPPDHETKDIWRQLGVQDSHILPFGTSDNFWEMGLVGPCGPCTEIHVDHVPDRTNAGARVNAGFSDLTELWNLVFIQFNRNKDGSLTPLKYSHVDTGMGFERLVALLNGVKSNYDTDLFTPLIQAIHKISGCDPYSHSFDENDSTFQKDKSYRILADHARLLTVAIADNVFPHLECKLRWVLRRALQISDNFMGKEGTGAPLLIELSSYVADSLHSVYPEIGKNLAKVERTISHEAEIYQAVRKEFPKNWVHLVKSKPELESLLVFGSNRSALSAAYRKMNSTNGLNSKVSPALAYHMYESHGMSAELIGEMAKISGKTFSVEDYEEEFEKRRQQSMLSTATKFVASSDSFVGLLDSGKVAKTNDLAKYDYSPYADQYSFPSVSTKVVGILEDGSLKKSAKGGSECGVVLDCTNFYHTAGGQASDEGEILVPSSNGKISLSVKEVSKVGKYVIHYGNLNGTLTVGDSVITKIDEAKRMACMRNHTLAHLITASMQQIFDAPLQEKCSVNPSHVKMAYNLHGQKLTVEEVKRLEESIQYSIDDQLPVSRYSVNSWDIPPGTTVLPDETYPVDNIHIIDVKRGNKIVSREACCGTHIMNTKDIGKFCISEVILTKKASVICALTGPDAAEASRNSITLSKNVNSFLKQVLAVRETVHDLISSNSTDLQTRQSTFDAIIKVHDTYNSIKKFMLENSRRISYLTYDAALTGVREGLSEIHSMARAATEFDVKRKAINANFVVHYLPLSECLEKILLSKYTRLVNGPVMLFALHENETKVRCCVPQEIVSENFNAMLWMQEVLPILVQSEGDVVKTNFSSEGLTLSIQSRAFVYKSKIPLKERKHRCYEGCKAASKFVSRQFKGKKEN
ncbi:alanine--tRNA ligase, mitochondrial-like isoform X2 [Thrips palmi]|uniref:Alanine--tRNA ligase n=1 Tax=Thrips palmi TaxID=161013 RepID=A0A6P8YLL8_THRPL|nr:alanine--tRNA ligase, mitochondrial-like isoform X2 [Thrips palmi]